MFFRVYESLQGFTESDITENEMVLIQTNFKDIVLPFMRQANLSQVAGILLAYGEEIIYVTNDVKFFPIQHSAEELISLAMVFDDAIKNQFISPLRFTAIIKPELVASPNLPCDLKGALKKEQIEIRHINKQYIEMNFTIFMLLGKLESSAKIVVTSSFKLPKENNSIAAQPE